MRETLEFPGKTAFDKVEKGSGPTWIRTRNQGIMSPQKDSTNAEPIPCCDDANSDDSTGRSTRNELDADLQRVLDAWPTLPEALRAGILAMIDAART